MKKTPSLSESITSVLQESKSDLIKKLDALTKEFVQLILKGEITNDDINEITGQFDGELYAARRKLNYNKIDPAKRAAAIEKGKATRAADKDKSAARSAKLKKDTELAKNMYDDGILPQKMDWSEGKVPTGVEKYYKYIRKEEGYPDIRGGGEDFPARFFYELKSQYVGKKVGTKVLDSLNIDEGNILDDIKSRD
jgi:hypothetical protein